MTQSLVTLCGVVPPQGRELVDAYPSADPIALTVDAHEHFAYSVEGLRVNARGSYARE